MTDVYKLLVCQWQVSLNLQKTNFLSYKENVVFDFSNVPGHLQVGDKISSRPKVYGNIFNHNIIEE